MSFRNRVVRISQLIADELIGAVVATASSGARWVLSGSAAGANYLSAHTGSPYETSPGYIEVDSVGHTGILRIYPPALQTDGTNSHQPEIRLVDADTAGQVLFFADQVSIQGLFGGASQIALGPNSTPIHDTIFGSTTISMAGLVANTGANINHGLGRVPMAFAIAAGRSSYMPYVWSNDGNSVVFGARNVQGAATNDVVTLYYLLIG